ncbi:MAG: hypothetical protein ACR2QE_13915 [Acidimicrobiales bacterium]
MTARQKATRQAHRAAGFTRRAYEFATVPRFRARGALVTAAHGDLRLLFRPATGEWFVEHDGRWYRPAGDDDVGVLLSELSVEFIDETQLRTIPHAGEEVWAQYDADTGQSHLELFSSGGQFVARIQRGEGDIPDDVIRWNDPVHHDQWVDLTAGFWAVGVSDLVLEVYLPPHDELGDKTMAVTVDQGGRRHTRTAVLTRGDPTRVPIYRGPPPAWGLRVGLHCQYPEPVSDSRELGFQLVSIERRR